MLKVIRNMGYGQLYVILGLGSGYIAIAYSQVGLSLLLMGGMTLLMIAFTIKEAMGSKLARINQSSALKVIGSFYGSIWAICILAFIVGMLVGW